MASIARYGTSRVKEGFRYTPFHHRLPSSDSTCCFLECCFKEAHLNDIRATVLRVLIAMVNDTRETRHSTWRRAANNVLCPFPPLDAPHSSMLQNVLVLSYATHATWRQVEALTLEREDGRYETACNLLRPKEVTPAMVLEVAKAQAARLNIAVVDEYVTGPTEEEIVVTISDILRRRLTGAV